MPYANKAPMRSAGFTLVELMIALVLGLIVVGGALALFVSQRVTSGLSSQMADVQNEGRLALDALARDVRAAGDFGCWPVTAHYVRLNSSTFFSSDQAGIRGFDKGATTIAASGIAAAGSISTLAPVSDVVAVTGIYGSLSQLAAPVLTGDTGAFNALKPTQDFKVKDVVIVTDCMHWSMLELTGVAASSATAPPIAGSVELSHAIAAAATSTYSAGNKYADLGAAYKAGATVGSLDTIWWFVAEVGGKKGLYRLSARDKQNGGEAQLVSNRVADIRVRYDLDTDADKKIDQTGKSASEITTVPAWATVRHAVVEVLVRSDKTSSSAAAKYTFGGVEQTPTDKHLYLPLELAISLRNQ